MKVFCAAFLWSQFGHVIFWRKSIGAKATRTMLMKLIRGEIDVHKSENIKYLSHKEGKKATKKKRRAKKLQFCVYLKRLFI